MDNSNQLIASRLEEISRGGKYSNGMSEALLRYAGIIRKMKDPLVDVSQMKGFGNKAKVIILDVIEEIRSSQDNESEEEGEDDDTFKMFMSIYGVTEKDARRYVAKGYTTPQDLLDEDIKDETRNYIHYYEDFNNAIIPYEELKFFHERVLIKIFDERLIEIVGGFRRGVDTSNTIEIIVKHTHTYGVLIGIIRSLEKHKYVTKKYFEFTSFHYNGVARIFEGEPFRHITITLIEPPHWGTTLLIKTGNDNFIKKIKDYANNKGIKIKDEYLVVRDKRDVKKIYPEYEEMIFEELDIEFIEPNDREKKRITFTPIED